MPRFHDLKRDYFYDQIDAETEVYAVIGDPIEQSLSPAIHNAAFRHLGLNKVLVPFLIPAGHARGVAQGAGVARTSRGISVTIPHKEAIIPLLDREGRRGRADRGRATRSSFEDGKRIGYNTDYRAAMDSLEDGAGRPIAGRRAEPARSRSRS